MDVVVKLTASDAGHLQAAQEFLKQGRPGEAGREMEHLSAERDEHPEVLETRWEVLAQSAQWEPALTVAEAFRRVAPDNHLAWLYHACSLTERGRLSEAYDLLSSAFAQFPKVPPIAYNLACTACKLGRFKDASGWLAKTIEIGGRAEVKLMALDDADLAPLLDEICAL